MSRFPWWHGSSNPGRFWSHANRAYTLAWLGRCNEAAAALRKAVELDPDSSSAVTADAHLSHYYYTCPKHFDLTEAVRHSRSACESDPEGGRRSLANALFREGDCAEAKRINLEQYQKNPEDFWFDLAMCLWHLGEKSEARTFYDRSAAWMDERVPDHPAGIRYRQEAAELLGIRP